MKIFIPKHNPTISKNGEYTNTAIKFAFEKDSAVLDGQLSGDKLEFIKENFDKEVEIDGQPVERQFGNRPPFYSIRLPRMARSGGSGFQGKTFEKMGYKGPLLTIETYQIGLKRLFHETVAFVCDEFGGKPSIITNPEAVKSVIDVAGKLVAQAMILVQQNVLVLANAPVVEQGSVEQGQIGNEKVESKTVPVKNPPQVAQGELIVKMVNLKVSKAQEQNGGLTKTEIDKLKESITETKHLLPAQKKELLTLVINAQKEEEIPLEGVNE